MLGNGQLEMADIAFHSEAAAEFEEALCWYAERSKRVAQGFSQAEVAAALQIDQPKVSKILRGRLREFSTDRLFRFLNALDQDIQIVIKSKPASRRQARLMVVSG